ncbi:hypothetical protein QQF64_002023 [Cirrhinus molitorella]|uniref:Uncharacterized protein n=1 Tax=Cirrhinus molitorella TaxID=172907 RepID=A0ABR3MP03_9TELE
MLTTIHKASIVVVIISGQSKQRQRGGIQNNRLQQCEQAQPEIPHVCCELNSLTEGAGSDSLTYLSDMTQ